MRLRLALLVVCTVALVAAVLLAIFVTPVFFQVAIAAAVVLAGLSFEARRYIRRFPADRQWQLTDEKFIDPTTGHLMQVRFDPRTGDRDYLDLGPSSTTP